MDRRTFLVASSVAGAVGASAASTGARAQACPEDTLDKIKASSTFNAGIREAAPPYGLKTASGEYKGFSTEIVQLIYAAVNKELGGSIKINYVPVTSQTRIPLLQNGTIDIEAGATVITRSRAKVVDFGLPHFATTTSVLVPENSPIKAAADLSGKRIGVPQGGLEEAMFRTANGKMFIPAVTVRGFTDHSQGVTALQTGTLDGYSTDEPILFDLGRKSAGYRVVPLNMNAATQAFLIRPGSAKFKQIVDLTIADICLSGRWQELYDTYFGASGPSLPLSEIAKMLVQINSWPA